MFNIRSHPFPCHGPRYISHACQTAVSLARVIYRHHSKQMPIIETNERNNKKTKSIITTSSGCRDKIEFHNEIRLGSSRRHNFI